MRCSAASSSRTRVFERSVPILRSVATDRMLDVGQSPKRRAPPGATRGIRVAGIDEIDFFSDLSLVEDPYPYFEELRAACLVLALLHLGVIAVTGYEEATE